jgi:hypothetical protein
MSTPTGSIYLQAYNKSSGKFIEIPENVAGIKFSARTGLQTGTILNQTPNFSGFIFSDSIGAKNLEMMPINIGTRNTTGDSIYAINLGLFNTNNVTITGFNYSGFVCSNNFGYFNRGSNTTYAFNLGGSNNVESSHQTYNIGANNLVDKSLYSFNLGILNSIYTGNNTYVLGISNSLVESTDVLIFGNENFNIKNINDSSIHGSSNNITTGDFIYSIGNQNNFNVINNIVNIGDQNNLNNSSFITLINDNNSISGSSYESILGYNNSSTNSNLNTTIGNGNSLSTGSSNNKIFGNLNVIGGTNNIINGDSNDTYSNVYQSNIYGSSNSLSGTSSNTIIGSSNSSDSSAFTLFVSGINITGSIAESKYHQIYMTGAQATGFFKFASPNLYNLTGFNGTYTTTDFSGYSKFLYNFYDEGEEQNYTYYGHIEYDPTYNTLYNCFKQNYPYDKKAWVLFLENPNYGYYGTDRANWLPAYTCIDLKSGNSQWSGLGPLYREIDCGYGPTSNNFGPNSTGNLTGYRADNADGFYTRTKADQNFTNIKGNTINFDEDGPALYYKSRNTGNLYSSSLERIYLTSGGETQDFSRWTGLKPYNSGKAFATGTPFTIYRKNLGGGINNFYLGDNNKATFNDYSFVLGSTNTLLDNTSSYVFGENNYLESNNSSYVFGDSNSMLGFQNYIIGNNNETRSGDYNSIFIGINYTPTGNNKVGTISLASVDSKIEITPSDISLDSVNRPKINGENIIIQSEFDTIANSLNQNGPTFTTLKFQDPYYDKLADKVFLSSFTYNSGAFTSLTFDAQEFSATSSLFLNKFFIYGTASYTGASGFNVIYGNHTNNQFPPAWLVVDNSTSGVYYKNDITPFNLTPQSGWYATGFRDNGLLYTGTSNNFGINLVMGSRQAYVSVNTALFGTMYVPAFY